MLDKLRGFVGGAVATSLGMSEEHRQVMASGKCQRCGASLVGLFVSSLIWYAADGHEIGKLAGQLGANLTADACGCRKCGHRWKLYGSTPAPAEAPQTLEVVETERSEEFYPEERRVVDNSRSAATPTRSFSFTKEWTRTFHIDLEHGKTGGAELSVGTKDAAALRLSSESTLRRTYSVTEETKQIATEEVSCQIPAHCKLTVVVRWKRIWQHGYIVAAGDAVQLRIPFRVAIGMTFDQQLIQEGGEDAASSLGVNPARAP